MPTFSVKRDRKREYTRNTVDRARNMVDILNSAMSNARKHSEDTVIGELGDSEKDGLESLQQSDAHSDESPRRTHESVSTAGATSLRSHDTHAPPHGEILTAINNDDAPMHEDTMVLHHRRLAQLEKVEDQYDRSMQDLFSNAGDEDSSHSAHNMSAAAERAHLLDAVPAPLNIGIGRRFHRDSNMATTYGISDDSTSSVSSSLPFLPPADVVPAHPETDRITGITREQNPALSLPSARQNLGGHSDLHRPVRRLSEDLTHYEAHPAEIDWLVAEYAMLE